MPKAKKTVNSIFPRIERRSAYGRVYEVEENCYLPSVTTVLRYGTPTEEFLFKYMLVNSGGDYQKHLHFSGEQSEIGTAIHDLCERIMLGEEIEISDNPLNHVPGRNYYPTFQTTLAIRKGLQSFLSWYEENQPNIVSLEQLLFSTQKDKDGNYLYPFCGRCDIIAVVDGEKWLLDIKSSKYVKNVTSYQIQLSMYKMLYDAMNPETPIDRIGVVWAKKDWASKVPKSVFNTFEYKYDPTLVKHICAIFNKYYDGFKLGHQPRLKNKVKKVFSLADTERIK